MQMSSLDEKRWLQFPEQWDPNLRGIKICQSERPDWACVFPHQVSKADQNIANPANPSQIGNCEGQQEMHNYGQLLPSYYI